MSAPDNSACRIRGNGQYEVEHWDCSDYADGIITDVRTGKIVAKKVNGERVDLR